MERPRIGTDAHPRHPGVYQRFRLEVPITGLARISEDNRRFLSGTGEADDANDDPRGSSSDGLGVEGSSRDSED